MEVVTIPENIHEHLNLAIKTHRLNYAQFLIDYSGADLNYYLDERSPIFMAFLEYDTLLLDWYFSQTGVNYNIVTRNGKSIVELLKFTYTSFDSYVYYLLNELHRDRSVSLPYLLSKKVNERVPSFYYLLKRDVTLLEYSKATRVIQTLLNYDIQIDYSAINDVCILFMLIINGHFNLFKIFLHNGCSPNSINSKGESLLTVASTRSLKFVKLLVKLGADTSYSTPAGDLAIDIARKNKKIKIVKYLTKYK